MASQPTSWISLAQRLKHPMTPLEVMKGQLMGELRVAMPAIVQSFNATKQTVVVQPAVKEVINVPTSDGQGGMVPVPTAVTLPELVDVPICVLRAGGFSVTVPIKAGDECLVVISDTCFNAWWANGGVQSREEKRRHDFSDAIAIFGIWSQPRVLSSYSTSSLQIRSDDGHTNIDVSAAQILVTPDNNTTQVKIVPGQVLITPDGGTTKLSVIAGEVDVTGVLKVNGTVVTVP